MLLKIKGGLPRLFRSISNDCLDIKEMAAMIAQDYLTGQWRQANTSNVTVQKLQGGHSNWLYQVTLSHNENEALDPNTVLLRIYGPNYGKFAAEQVLTDSLVFMLMAERKLGPKLHAVFPGGRIEEYINARSLKMPELNHPKISLAIASKIAQMHSICVPISKCPEPIFDLISKWHLDLQNNWDQFKPKDIREEKLIDKFKSWNIPTEIQWLKHHLTQFNSKVVFCHNDLQEGNILIRHDSINDDEPSLVVIDYEYCSYNYRAFELANHFLECTMGYKVPNYPYFTVDSSLYPSPQQQVKFVRKYLTVYNELTSSNSPHVQTPALGTDRDWEGLKVTAEEHDLLTEISHFRLLSHLMWGVWSAAYSRSGIQFAYWEYSISRLNSYYETKEEIMTSEEPQVKKKC